MLSRLKDFFRKNKLEDKDAWASVVLLQREVPLLDEAKVTVAANAAFKSATLIHSEHFRWIFQVATTYLSVTTGNSPYFDPEPHQAAAQQSAYDRAWAEHRAWISIDAPQTTGQPKEIRISTYRVLLPFAEELWAEGCTGLYLPAEGVTAPSMGGYGATLRWSRMNRDLRRVTAELGA